MDQVPSSAHLPGVPTPLTQLVADGAASGGVGLALTRVCRIVSDVASQLDALHARGLAHGHVQASLVQVPPRGAARLLGPPQEAGVDARHGDVAGLAAVAYFALVGEAPSYFHSFSSGGDGGGAALAHPEFAASPGLQRPDLPPAASDVVVRGLTRGPGEPFASAGAFAAALHSAAQEGATAPLWTTAMRSRFAWATALVLVVALGVWLGQVSWRWRSPSTRPVAARLSPDPAPAPPPVPSAQVKVGDARAALSRPPSPAESKGPILSAAALAAMLRVDRDAPVKTASLAPPRPALSKGYGAPAPPQALVPSGAALRWGYLRVFARQFVTYADLRRHRAVPVRARRVLVDGQPSAVLAAGLVAQLPVGTHKIAFYPVPGIPFDPNTQCWVHVRPRSRRAVQVPLPRHPGGVSRRTVKQNSRPSGIMNVDGGPAADGNDTTGG